MRHACVALTLLACTGLATGPARADGDGETGLLRVGTSGDYPPFSRAAADASLGVEGFDIDVARAYAEARGLELQLVRFRWPELLDDLAAGRFDVVMSGVTVRPERSVAGLFTVPVLTSGAVLLLRDDGRFADASALDAAWVRIAVNAGGHLERTARARFPNATLLPIADNGAVLAELGAGRVDAVMTDTVEAPLWQARLPGLRRLGPLTQDHKAYLLPANDGERAADLDRWLLAREADGTLARLRAQWIGEGAAPAATPLAALLAAVKERLALMPAVAEAKRPTAAVAERRSSCRSTRPAGSASAPPRRRTSRSTRSGTSPPRRTPAPRPPPHPPRSPRPLRLQRRWRRRSLPPRTRRRRFRRS